MKFTAGFLAVLAFIPQAVLAVEFTNSAFVVTEGQPFTLTWDAASGPVTITLKNGASSDLKTVETIASGITASSYTWTPESSLASDTYAFEIVDSTNVPNYSTQFSYQGSGVATTGSTSASATASSTGSSSATDSSLTTSASSTISLTTSATSLTTSTASVSNSTMTTRSSSSSSTRSRTSTTEASSSSTSTSSPTNTNDGKRLGSSLAFVLGAVGALMAFN